LQDSNPGLQTIYLYTLFSSFVLDVNHFCLGYSSSLDGSINFPCDEFYEAEAEAGECYPLPFSGISEGDHNYERSGVS